jgi:two-component system CheB/CheR fusion protein
MGLHSLYFAQVSVMIHRVKDNPQRQPAVQNTNTVTRQLAKSAPPQTAPHPVPGSRASEPARPPFPIVALGASAGGLEALEQFLTHVPSGSGMAFVVIQHLDPDRSGLLPELLQRATVMPVVQALNGMTVQPDCVYVIPPNRDLSILHDILYLLEPVAPRGLRLPVDFFFRSLADDRGESAVGVILSGMGSDGSLGLCAIKEKGGLVAVQDPATARFDGMPGSAIGIGLADLIATAADLPQRILEVLGRAKASVAFPVTPEIDTEDQKSGLEKVCILLRARTGHDFSRYKKNTLYRRIERRMAIHQLDGIANYIRYLRATPQEVDLLFKELLIGVTSFFRDPAAWQLLQEQALPELLAACPEGAVLRAWVVGCSTGEEAYSLAIVFREVLERIKPSAHFSLQIFATDLDTDAIARARQGKYPANIAADVSAGRLSRYFLEEDHGYRVGKEIREMVVFAPQNVISDPPFTKLDIVTCRNLLIYLGTDLQREVLPLFHYSLKPGGILMLGSSETVGGFADLFTPLDSKARLYWRGERPPRAVDLVFPTHSLVPSNKTIMDSKPQIAPSSLQEQADQLLLQKFSPAAVLVNSAGDLVYISGRTGKYLEPASGKVNWNIHAMAREGLRNELALAMHKAQRSGETVTRHKLTVDTNGGSQTLDLTVHPVTEPAALSGMIMVLFTDAPTRDGAEAAGKPARKSRRSPRVAELEVALTEAGQAMQALREEMQGSQEELKSANEELQSTNEEMQSTNEELTTSKEEMQSLNEELQTVNAELQSKVDELSSANDDMKNLLNSTDLATVFLNNALHVRRFTTQATRLFKLIATDVGRPLSDIVTDLDYPALTQDAQEVLRTLTCSDREISTSDGRWYQTKIMPYRTMQNVIDGVVITFSDISRAKQLEAQLRKFASDGRVPP